MAFSDITFTLEELDEGFWQRVIYVEKWYSSGLGGPGCLWMVTSDKLLYEIGFETFPYDENNLEQFAPFFEIERYDKEQWRDIYKIESEGWKVIDSGMRVWIRQEYSQEFEEELEKAKQEKKYVFMLDVFLKMIGVETDREAILEANLKCLIEKQQKDWEEVEKEKERTKLLQDHFEWKPLYMNNCVHSLQEGEYALIFRKIDNEIQAFKFSIVYQRQEVKPLQIKIDVPPELYILFENRYSEVIGPYCYPDPNHDGFPKRDEEKNTFNNSDMNDYGRFVRAFKTMEEAKEYAAVVATDRWRVNRNNLFVPV